MTTATNCLLGGARRFFVVSAETLRHSHRDVKLLIVLRLVRLLGHGGTILIRGHLPPRTGVPRLGRRPVHDPDAPRRLGHQLRSGLRRRRGRGPPHGNHGFRFDVCRRGGLCLFQGEVIGTLGSGSPSPDLANSSADKEHSPNEIDPFKPIEESTISCLSNAETCSDLFAWWSMLGMLGTAASNLLTGQLNPGWTGTLDSDQDTAEESEPCLLHSMTNQNYNSVSVLPPWWFS
ncbi:hypothetical protein PG994_002324 [Apiospora phragmitis]|uniref:Uncharacterized protein n=1 Tax=Apiospora phragmitis TaxID=2905665 RepID=A0ABR1WW25_9PEZI